MNEYELTYALKSMTGVFKESIKSASEQDARNLLRARFGGQDVRIQGGRMTEFGGGFCRAA
jgi:hypothetical protein